MTIWQSPRPTLADDGDADLARIGQILFDLFSNIFAKDIRGVVVHVIGIDHDPDFAPGLNGIGLSHPVEAGGDAFQFFEALDVIFEQFLARAGSGP